MENNRVENKPEWQADDTYRKPRSVNTRENSTDANLDREDQNAEVIEKLDREEALRLSDKIPKDDNTNRRQQKKYPDRRGDNP